jgi:hypothetical protein
MRFGVTRLIVAGMVAITAGYVLFLRIDLDSSYVLGVLPTVLLAGVGFALAFGPLNVAATSGVAPEEQGLGGRDCSTPRSSSAARSCWQS